MVSDPDTQSDERAGRVLVNGTLVTMDAERSVYAPGYLQMEGNAIADLGAGQPEDLDPNVEVIDCSGCVVIPGLINTHTHMPMSLLRGLADDLRLDVWLYGYILPVEREFVTPEFCYLGTLLSCAEMIRGGTTCFTDMYYREEDVAWAAVQAGMRGVCGQTITKLPAPDADSYEESLQYCADFMSHWRQHPLITATAAPHSLYMTTPEILREAITLTAEADVPQLIHVAETEEEVTQWLAATSMRPFRWLAEQGLLGHKLVAAHCVHVNSEEIHLMAQYQVGVAHDPTSNLKLASGIAPVQEMLAQGVSVGIGTDGCASNNDLDMLEEMRLAALLSKGVTRNPLAVPAEEALAMATIRGARALGLEDRIGSIEVGKRADVTVLRLDRLHNMPRYNTTGQNIYSQIVYASQASDVRDVYIDGQQVLRQGRLCTLDEERIRQQVMDIGQRVNAFFLEREESLVEKLVDIGGVRQHEAFEVQAKGVIGDEGLFQRGLEHPQVYVTEHTSRDQFDTYFLFEDESQGRLRYREDQVIAADGTISPIYNLTLMGPAKEAEYNNSVLLSRARYSAPADRSLRFYREYFQPVRELEITKHRERYHIRYRGLDFAVNYDQIMEPEVLTAKAVEQGMAQRFLEIKSRTWSKQDAVYKAGLIGELLRILGTEPEAMLGGDYADILFETNEEDD